MVPLSASRKVGLVLVVLYLVAWLDRMAINMTIPFLAQDLGIGPERIGWILSAFFAGYALFQIPGGLLVDRFGARRVILVSLGWWSALTALTGAAGGLVPLLTTRFFFGVGEGLFPPAVWKVLGGWFTKRNRATANALVISSIALGPALTPLVLAPLLATYGWRVCFYLLGTLGLFCVALAAVTVRDSIRDATNVPPAELAAFERDARSAAANAEGSLATARFRDLLHEPAVWVLFAIGLVFNVTMYGWLNWLPSYLMKVKGLDLEAMAYAASLPFVFGAAGCMTAGWVSDRWFRGRRRVLVALCMAGGGACLYLFTRVADPVAYMALQCVAGFLLFMACGAVWSLPMILLPPRLMGAGSGFVNTGGQIGGVVTNLAIGYYIAFRGGDYAAGFDVMLGALGVAVALALLGLREAPATRVNTLAFSRDLPLTVPLKEPQE